MELTASTTREAFATHLRARYAETFKPHLGYGNEAIRRHAKKVEAMNEAQWLEHRASLVDAAAQFAASGTAKRLARELFSKQ